MSKTNISKIPWSCKRIEKAVIIFIILYTVKWNCCSLLKSILKIIISRLKATWSKQSFYDDATSFLPWDRNFHMNAGWKSPHLAEPAHIAGPAHLIQSLNKVCRLQVKNGLRYRCFLVNFAKILNKTNLQKTHDRMLLIFSHRYLEIF